jgi:hypothetical protein
MQKNSIVRVSLSGGTNQAKFSSPKPPGFASLEVTVDLVAHLSSSITYNARFATFSERMAFTASLWHEALLDFGYSHDENKL